MASVRGRGAAPRVAAVLAALALAGCAAAPKSGPTSGAVRAVATAPEEAALPYAFVALTVETVATLEARRRAPPEDLPREAASGPRLRTGDAVVVTIWEAVEGGLFSGGEGSPRGTSLPAQRIGPSGEITVPYAGQVRAAGRTPEAVARAVEAALEGKAIEPQVLVTQSASPASAVTVIGDAAARSGRVRLDDVGERVLDVIAAAGGATTPAHRALVRLTRGDRVAETHLARILREPAQNVPVRAGDVVAVLESGASYTVLGAAARPRRANFASEVVTLDQAIAEAGGLDDNRSDPGAVFVFRYEPSDVAEAVAGAPQPAPVAAVVYNLDLTDPSAFFLARRFEILDDDIVFVANAPLADAQKVLRSVATAFTPALAALRLGVQLD